MPKSYEGSLQQFETEPSVSEALLQKIGPDQDSVDGSDIESMDRLIEEDAPPGPGNPEHCPHCGEKGELIGFEMEGGNDWEHRVNGYECECGAEWEVQITGWDRPDGR